MPSGNIGQLPAATEPVHPMADCNAQIPLFDGEMVLTRNGSRSVGTGTVFLDWLPSPRVRFSIRISSGDPANSGETQLALPSLGRRFDVLIFRVSIGSNGHLCEGVLQKELSSWPQVTSLIAQLCNLGPYNGDPIRRGDAHPPGRLSLTDDKYVVAIDPVRNCGELIEAARANGGYALTHVCAIHRRDGGPFKIMEPLEPLFRFLSFARGAWCGFALPVGFHEDGQVACEPWKVWKSRPFLNQGNWFPHYRPQRFAQAYARFSELWRVPEARRALGLGIAWYVHALSIGELEGRIIQAVAGLELLSWYGLLHWRSPPVRTEKEFSHFGTDRKIRDLLETCDVSPTIPPELQESYSFRAGEPDAQPKDGPQLLCWVRNSIVHPVPRVSVTPSMRHEVVQLALYYIELVILRFVDYDGLFTNRITWQPGSAPQNQYESMQ